MKLCFIVGFSFLLISICSDKLHDIGLTIGSLSEFIPAGVIRFLKSFGSDQFPFGFSGVAASSIGLLGFFETTCPNGWSIINDMGIRTIITVGATTDTRGERRAFILRDRGGELNTNLTVENLPRHNHNLIAEGRHGRDPYPANNFFSCWGDMPHEWTTREMSAEGGGASHNNMPPYLVIRACWKTTNDTNIDFNSNFVRKISLTDLAMREDLNIMKNNLTIQKILLAKTEDINYLDDFLKYDYLLRNYLSYEELATINSRIDKLSNFSFFNKLKTDTEQLIIKTSALKSDANILLSKFKFPMHDLEFALKTVVKEDYKKAISNIDGNSNSLIIAIIVIILSFINLSVLVSYLIRLNKYKKYSV